MTQEEAALKFVNKVRAMHGKKPRKSLAKGDPGSPRSCPIANSLTPCGDEISVGDLDLDVSTKSGIVNYPLPSPVTKFVRAFDEDASKKYPHLIASK